MRRGHVRQRGGKWCVVIDLGRDENGRRLRRWHSGFVTRKDAEKGLTKILRQVDEHAYVPVDRSTVSAYFQAWMQRAAIDLRPATADSYRRVFARYIEKHIGSQKLQALTPTRLNTLYGELMKSGGAGGARISASTCRQAHVLLHRMLASAVKEGLVVRNVSDAAEPPKQRRVEQSIWSQEQLASFLRASETERLAALWRLYVVTGCRRGEALGLKWSDVDLEGCTLEIRRSLGVVNGRPTYGAPKTGSGRRRIALDEATVAALRAHRKRQNEERLALGAAYADDGLVFCQEDGRLLHPNVMTRVFYRLAERAQLPKIRLHDVRHSAVTAMLRAGIPVKVVSERVGHASTSFTMDVYASVLPDMQADAAARIASAIDG